MSCNLPDGPLGRVLARLQQVSGSGTQWKARCPAHNDSTPSLSITLGADGRVLVNCHASCSFEAVRAALGLEARDFFDEAHSNPARSSKVLPPPGPTSGRVVSIGVPPSVGRKDPEAFTSERGRALWAASIDAAISDAHFEIDAPVRAFVERRGLQSAVGLGLVGFLPEEAARQAYLGFWFTSGYRFVAPFYNHAGELVGIQGRKIDAGEPKTMFPKGSKVKGNAFANPMALARFGEGPREAGVVMVGEGLTDYCALAGLAEFAVVSAPGTSFVSACVTDWAKNAVVILAVDNDAAGQKTVIPAARAAFEHGATRVVRVVWPGGAKDACDALEKLGPEGLKDFIRGVLEQSPEALLEAAVSKTSSYEIDASQFVEAGERELVGASTSDAGATEAHAATPAQAQAPAHKRRQRFAVGDSVRATDYDNIGTILSIDGDKAYVAFVNKRTGGADKVYLPLSALERTRKHSTELPRRLTVAQTLELEPPKQFVEGMFVRGSLIVVYGPSNCGKSFFALDLALCVASGEPFTGRKCDQGRACYVAGEGLGGIKHRMLAWNGGVIDQPNEAPWTNFDLYAGPIGLLNDALVDKLIDDILAMPVRPTLLIVDTLARSFVGGDENTAKDMSAFVASCDLIREETGVAVLLIHHTGKAKKGDPASERGSTALRGSVDTMIEIEVTGERDDDPRIVKCSKERELKKFEQFAFVLEQVTTAIRTGEPPTTSCRLRYVDVPDLEAGKQKSNADDPSKLHEKVAAICDALRQFGDGAGMARGRLQKNSRLSETTFDRYLKAAMESELVVKKGEGPQARYFLKEQLPTSTPTTPKRTPTGVVGDPRTTTPNSPPSLEGGVGGGGGVRAGHPDDSSSVGVGVRQGKQAKNAKRTKRSTRGSKK